MHLVWWGKQCDLLGAREWGWDFKLSDMNISHHIWCKLQLPNHESYSNNVIITLGYTFWLFQCFMLIMFITAGVREWHADWVMPPPPLCETLSQLLVMSIYSVSQVLIRTQVVATPQLIQYDRCIALEIFSLLQINGETCCISTCIMNVWARKLWERGRLWSTSVQWLWHTCVTEELTLVYYTLF